MGEYFASILIPNDVWSRITPRSTQEGYFMAQDVFIIEMRGQSNFGSLKIKNYTVNNTKSVGYVIYSVLRNKNETKKINVFII